VSKSAPAPRVLYVAEPAGPWALHPPAVADCSVIAAVLWAEPAAEQARLQMAQRSLHAPMLLIYELANVARNKCRSGVPEAVARAGLEMFNAQRVLLHEVELPALFDTASRHGLSAYDAAYLALAALLQAPLLTFDHKLAEAARGLLGAQE
jgi:predicted nucleic acid-binding protein